MWWRSHRRRRRRGQGSAALKGGKGSDVLHGGDGEDRLIGGAAKNKLTGGDRSDTFIFRNGSASNRVTDFAAGATGSLAPARPPG